MTVILPFGRYFAGRADMLTREGFKTVFPIDGVSPFSGVGEPDPELQHFADSERTNERVQTEVRKNLRARLAQADAQYLVVDNSTALMLHREVNGRLYTLLPGEATDLMDTWWNADPTHGRALAVKLSHGGFRPQLASSYDSFIRACLDGFSPTRIILVRSHVARFWIAADGTIAPTNADKRDPGFLEALDSYFVEQTGCRVASGTLGHFPSAISWQTFDHRLRRVIEEELVALLTSDSAPEVSGAHSATPAGRVAGHMSAADHVVGAFRQSCPVDPTWLIAYFAAGGASYDDLLALAYLKQQNQAGDNEWIRTCVRNAVADPGSHPLAETRRRFDNSIRALRRWPYAPLGAVHGWRRGSLQRSLRGWRWGQLRDVGQRRRTLFSSERLSAVRGWWRALRASPEDLWSPEIVVPCGSVVLRFLGDGTLRRIRTPQLAVSGAGAVVGGRVPVTPLNLLQVLGSWAVYLERGRRGLSEPLRVVVPNVKALVETCSWIDWASVLDNECVVITNEQPGSVPAHGPQPKTDLSFFFHPNTRIGTIGGGLMDQVTHIALYDDLCAPDGFTYYLDDFRYTWWRSHNGFEASRLAPQLEGRRLTRLVSQALVESFRDEVMRTRLPWVFNQSRVWYELGLPEATVVTGNHPDSRRLMEVGPEFPVRVYTSMEELAELIREPPSPMSFFTTLDRIPGRAESANAIRRVFSYHHLEASGLDPEVSSTAELLRSAPHVAFHVRRGDFLHPHFDTDGWHSEQSHYIDAIDYLINSEFGTGDFNVAVFSDDLEFVEAHVSDYGLDRVQGAVRFVQGNSHFRSIFDSYLMSLCPIIVGSVGSFAATTSLLADPPSVFIRTQPNMVQVKWRR